MVIEKHLIGQLDVYGKLMEINHPYLPKLYEATFENGNTHIVEEYIEGGSIGTIKAGATQISKWFYQLCHVLKFLHSHGILHRDIKPSNILIGKDGHIRLIDFDAARQTKEASEAESDTRLLGTRGYAPPEQYGFSQTDVRADVYSLGITLQELTKGQKKCGKWKRFIHKCTRLEPKHRYRSVAALQRAIFYQKLRRYILYPICSLFALYIVGAIGITTWGYSTNSQLKPYVDIAFGSVGNLVFSQVPIEEYRDSPVILEEFTGNVQQHCAKEGVVSNTNKKWRN